MVWGGDSGVRQCEGVALTGCPFCYLLLPPPAPGPTGVATASTSCHARAGAETPLASVLSLKSRMAPSARAFFAARVARSWLTAFCVTGGILALCHGNGTLARYSLTVWYAGVWSGYGTDVQSSHIRLPFCRRPLSVPTAARLRHQGSLRGFMSNIECHPILFSGPMTRALLDGTKTQTRRIMKPQPLHIEWFDHQEEWCSQIGKKRYILTPCPYGQPGDLSWVRETFCIVDDTGYDGDLWVDYRATPKYRSEAPAGWDNAPDDPDALKWKPSIHMPRWASRLTLEITNVRVERLQDISEEDAIAEGIESTRYWRDEHPASICYAVLWDSINGLGSWERNEWAWSLSFRVHQQNVDALLAQRTAA